LAKILIFYYFFINRVGILYKNLVNFAIYEKKDSSQMLEDIRKNIERLIALYEGERQQKERLVLELRQRDEEIDSYKKQIADLERQVDNLKLTEAFTAPAGSGDAAKEKIDRLITEIDRCISLLEK
jgi:predicted  nucleic acid-binding Zn-ribbon protein